jgi:hypothetical protein
MGLWGVTLGPMLQGAAKTWGVALLVAVACSGSLDPVSSPTTASDGMRAAEPASSSPTPDRCFGDSAPEQIATDPRPRDLFANEKEVLWRSGQLLHRMDASGRTSTLDVGALYFIDAVDSREVFGSDHQLNLLAIDLSSGKLRPVSPSSAWSNRVSGLITLFGANYVLDSDYVYVGWRGDPAVNGFLSSGGERLRSLKGPHDAGLLSRVRRDGSSAPELFGKGPDTPFVVSDGYAYWGSRWEGLKRRALVPGASSEMVWTAPDVPLTWPIGISGGRLYFRMLADMASSPRMFTIASVPAQPASADGGAAPPPRVHVPPSPQPFNDAILLGHCVYSGGPGGVVRADLDDGSVKTLIEGRPVPGDGTLLFTRLLASDGRSLYWADYGGDRVVRWTR